MSQGRLLSRYKQAVIRAQLKPLISIKYNNCIDLWEMQWVSALDSGSSGPGSSFDWGHCCVLGQDTFNYSGTPPYDHLINTTTSLVGPLSFVPN